MRRECARASSAPEVAKFSRHIDRYSVSPTRNGAAAGALRGRRNREMLIAVSVGQTEKAKGAKSPYFQALLAAGAAESEIKMVSVADAARVRAEHYDGI